MTHEAGPRRFLLMLVLVALAATMVACGGDDDSSAPTDNQPAAESDQGGEAEEGGGTISIEGQDANDHGEEDVAGMSSVDLEADDFYFEPTVLTGEAGQELTIHIENEGDSAHNFSISDQNIDEDVDPGEDAEVTVTFPDSGTLVYFCKFHQSSGMLGGLEVGS